MSSGFSFGVLGADGSGRWQGLAAYGITAAVGAGLRFLKNSGNKRDS